MSVFLDENSVLRQSEENLNRIIIAGVQGILKETLKFSVESDWEPLISLADRFQGTQALLSFATGSRLFNAGIWTKRFWKGGSYLKINPVMRIVDKDGTGNVLRDSRKLLDLCLPVYKGDKSLSDREKILQEMNAIREKIAKKLSNPISTISEGISDLASLASQEGFNDAAGGLISFVESASTNGPKPVRVSMSNFFNKTCIIESVDVEFSKEMTDFGPLYADLNLVLSSQEITTKGDTGLSNGGDGPIVRRG